MTAETSPKVRVGVPYRTRKEELKNERESYDKYLAAARAAGAETVEISLGLSAAELSQKIRDLDAFILPGSPADVHPSLFKAVVHPNCSISDPCRESTDFGILAHAFQQQKPVLAICYGTQSLNVFLGGTLVQDIPAEIATQIPHPWTGHAGPEPHHQIQLEPNSRLAQRAGSSEIRVNSSHHQSVLTPGKNLRIVAHAPDGVVEAVEWTGDSNWVTGVQWHPERMAPTDLFSQSLFAEFVSAAKKSAVHS
ncbi:MAG TPA: gamma-glutamyl-gamma-aminobutyrate hydrolase family protein [Candidatus Acidoferrales bacterium]